MAFIPLRSLAGSRSVEAEFERIFAWATIHLPELAASLRSGTSTQQLDEAEALLGRKLPTELRELYLLADGQTDDGPGLFFGLPFIPLDRLTSERKSWDEVADQGRDDGISSEFLSSDPAGAIQLRYAHRGWLPVSHDWGGNHIGVDIEPGPSGTLGQVINFGRDEDAMYVMANSLSAFLGWLADSLAAGNFRIERNPEGETGGVEFLLAEPQNEHFLDAIQELAD